MQRRLERFDAKLAQSGLDALLVTGQKNIYYLTDFWGQMRLSSLLRIVASS